MQGTDVNSVIMRLCLSRWTQQWGLMMDTAVGPHDGRLSLDGHLDEVMKIIGHEAPAVAREAIVALGDLNQDRIKGH